jgi:hypothetical protein
MAAAAALGIRAAWLGSTASGDVRSPCSPELPADVPDPHGAVGAGGAAGGGGGAWGGVGAVGTTGAALGCGVAAPAAAKACRER